MWYLFFQMFIWLALAFLLGLILGCCLCGKGRKSADKDYQAAQKLSSSLVKKTPDDLKKINGIGKVLEKKLNKLDIYTFAQVADFTKKDIAAINKTLSFQGRIEREKWVSQAKKLVAGSRSSVSRKTSKK